jgi:hypothetical protein
MKRFVVLFTVLALIVLALFFWNFARTPAPTSAAIRTAPSGSRPSSADTTTARQPQTPASKAGMRPADERSSLADALNSPATDIRADVRLITEILATFRSNFHGQGNPVGNNAEITAALSGRNKLRLALVPPDHPAINQNGELCDRWGTPYFFHAESASRMEIRSAGPDRKMWTDDDVTFAP